MIPDNGFRERRTLDRDKGEEDQKPTRTKKQKMTKSQASARVKKLKKKVSSKSKKSSFGRRRRTPSTTAAARRRRMSSFGVGGSYMPLSSIMSPYPSSVSAGPAWI